MIAAVIPSRACPPDLLALLRSEGVVPVVVDGNGAPHIYAWWNAGVRQAREFGADHIAILNDDITILPGSLTAMAGVLDDPTIGVVYPNVTRRLVDGIAALGTHDTTGTFPAGMTGFAFMFRAGLGILFDEGYLWWRGDHAFEEKVRAAGLRVCRDVGIPIEHTIDENGQGTTAAERRAEITPLIEQDRARWEARHLPSIALVMIVRDEAEHIEACLASARPYISAWTIVDTGSVDDTPQRVEAALAGVPGTLHRRPWHDFGHNRTEALELARGSADWLLLLDGDMTVQFDPDFAPDPSVDAYMVEWGNPEGFSWRMPMVIRGDRDWEYAGAVHAYLRRRDGVIERRVNTDQVRIINHGLHRASPAKTRRQAEGLEATLAERPDDPRTVFYLAQSYRELGDPRARDLYRRRAGMGGFAEEAFYAAYRGALLDPWPEQAASLLAAWEMRPSRLEPLHALIRELNTRRLHRAAYQLVTFPVEPCTDVLFVHRDVWTWGMKFERSIAAWHVGRVDESRGLCDELLAMPRLPANIRAAVERNRAFCEPRTVS